MKSVSRVLMFIGTLGITTFIGFTVGNLFSLLSFNLYPPDNGIDGTTIFWDCESLYISIFKWFLIPIIIGSIIGMFHSPENS